MYSMDWNQYMFNIRQQLKQQEERIRHLENKLTELETELKNKTPPTIEKVEYKFDQLKIETLSGSLHIGLSPEELKNMEDLSLPPFSKTHPQSELQPLLSDLQSYLQKEGPSLIRQIANEKHRQVDDSFIEMLLQDIEKQLPERIQYYDNAASNHHPPFSDDDYYQFVMNKVKEEIYRSLQSFMKNRKE